MVGSIRKFDSKDEEDEEDWISCEFIDFVFGMFKLFLPLKVFIHVTPLFSFLFLLIVEFKLDQTRRNILCRRKLRFCSSSLL